jgi:hypothetical protein
MKLSNDLQTYSILFGAASAYALALSTRPGRKFSDAHTAETVVLGVGLVLAALRFLLSASAFRRVVAAFVVAGLPLVARSLLKRFSGASAEGCGRGVRILL